MLRKLLHERTWAKAFELTGLPVRRRHKNHIKLKIDNDGTVSGETEYSDSDRNSEDSDQETDTTESCTSSSCTDAEALSVSKMLRQNAVDSPRTISSSCSSWGSNFGYVRYFDNNSDMNLEEPQFVVKDGCTHNIFDERSCPNSTFQSQNLPLQNSMQIGFNKLQPLFPHSESTDNSSFEVRPYMACEDLVNMDQNMHIDMLGNDKGDFVPTRRSVPNYSIKIENIPKLWKSTEEKYNRSEIENDHALNSDLLENLDPPSPKSESERYSIDSIVIDPPPMFRNDDEDLKIINVNLNTNVPFRKHSLNSDKKIRRSVSRSMVESQTYNKNDCTALQRMSSQSEHNTVRRKCECCNRSICPSPRSSDSGVVGSCNLASPELNMQDYSGSSNAGNDSDSHDKGLSQLKDTLTNLSDETFDSTHRNKLTLSEIEAATYEDQCRCTSPFGSTARTSCVTSVTSETSVDVADLSATQLTSTYVGSLPLSSTQIKRTSIRRNIERYVPEIKLKPNPPPRLYRKPSTHLEVPKNVRIVPSQWSTLNITERSKPSLHYHMRIYREKPGEQNQVRPSRIDTLRNRDVNTNDSQSVDEAQTRKTRSRSEDLSKLQKGLAEAQTGFMVYRSDLYAHWWMKAKLPITVVTDSGKDYSFVKRYCFVYHWFEDNIALKFRNH